MEKKRLSKALAAAGIASRRACEALIFSGRVQVNHKTVKVPQTFVDWEADRISVDGEVIQREEKKVYYMFHKPRGVICSHVRGRKTPIVLDFFLEEKKRLFTVGRLDKDTTGLLLVTNDGHFADAVIHPSSNVVKEYLVKAMQEISAEHLEALAEGARVDNRWIRPVSVQKVRRGTFKICVKEGKKHEVRIMAERAGLRIAELTRIRIGGLILGSLPPSESRVLSQKDQEKIFQG